MTITGSAQSGLRRSVRQLLVVALLPLFFMAVANGDYSDQRSEFLKAEIALKNKNTEEYSRLKRELKGYPLLPYLEFQELKRRLPVLTDRQAERFLLGHLDTPLADRFRRYWLSELGKRRQWKSYLHFYQPTENSKRRCLYLQSLLKTGRTDEALAQVEPLWLSARSQPKACDPVFTSWKSAGRLTPPLIWQRIALAMDARQTSLARYLARSLPEAEQIWFKRWMKVHRQPQKITDQDLFSDHHPYREEIILHGLKRLARKNPDAAISVWKLLQQRYDFSPEQHYQAGRSQSLALIREDHPETLERLTTFDPRDDDSYLHEARIRTALSQRAWKQALSWIEALPPTLAGSERWQYWHARALEAQGNGDQARTLYESLSLSRSYYGFLAADRIEGGYNLQHIPLDIAQDHIEALASRSGMQRVEELLALGRLTDARREWRYAIKDLSNPQLQAAAKLAQSWDWHPQAIFTLARTEYWDDLELRFPVAHRQQVEKAAGRQRLDNAWVYAVIRQESAFASDAVSPAGARGLMQLMPSTARNTARRIKRPAPKTGELLLPGTNITLGTSYLSTVLGQLDNNPVLATSAYNAGPHRVRKWLPKQISPADIWIETIPFKETRRYTQRVLTYAVIYDQRLGNKATRLEERMPPILPRNRTTAEVIILPSS